MELERGRNMTTVHLPSLSSSPAVSQPHSKPSRSRIVAKRREQIRQVKTCCQQFFAFFFSNLGLLSIVVSYVFFGGLIFQALELENELLGKSAIAAQKNATVQALLRLVQPNNNNGRLYYNVSSEELHDTFNTMEKEILKEVERYTDDIVNAIQTEGWNGKATDMNWSFEGSLLFAVTVVTTIGYGHAAPKTMVGRVMTILYAIFGIPLTFLFMSHTGDYMAKLFKVLYATVSHEIYQSQPQKVTLLNTSRRPRHLPSVMSSKQPDFQSKPDTLPTVATDVENCVKEPSKEASDEKVVDGVNVTTPVVSQNEQEMHAPLERRVINASESAHVEAIVPSRTTTTSGSNLSSRQRHHCRATFLPSVAHQRRLQRHLKQNFIQRSISQPHWEPASSTPQIVKPRVALPADLNHLHNIPTVCWQQLEPELVDAISLKADNHYPRSSTIHSPPSHFVYASAAGQLERAVGGATPVSGYSFHSPLVHYKRKRERGGSRRPDLLSSEPTVLNNNSSFDQLLRRISYSSQGSATLPQESRTQVNSNTITFNNVPAQSEHQRKTSLVSSKSSDHAQRRVLDVRQVTVPISLTLLVMVAYIFLGVIVFIVWEDRDIIKWSYFCFITLSTIGFGDIIPGTKIDDKNPKEKLIILAIYAAFGLALMTMCFKLMQEEVIAKFKRLGRQLKLLLATSPSTKQQNVHCG